MAADCTLAKGVQFWYSTNSGSSYTQLTDLVSLGSPGGAKAAEVEKTPLDPTDNTKEYASGLEEPGAHDFKQFWNDDREIALRALKGVAGVLWRTYYPDRTLLANRSHEDYMGTLNELSKEELGSADARLILVAKVKITGAVTFTGAT